MDYRRKFVGVADASQLGVTFRVSKDKKSGAIVTSSSLDTVVSKNGNLVVPTWPLAMLNKPVAKAGDPTTYLEFRLEEVEQK
jgi:hypothetical protein